MSKTIIDPQELGKRMYDRALEADEGEWATMVAELETLSPVQRVVFWATATSGIDRSKDLTGEPKLRTIEIHKHVAGQVLAAFKVPLGSAGVGVVAVHLATNKPLKESMNVSFEDLLKGEGD